MVPTSTAWATDLPITDPTANECHDGIDNDSDGRADTEGVWTPEVQELFTYDRGCNDNSPDSEEWTYELMTIHRNVARARSKDTLREVFGDKFQYTWYEKSYCKRQTRIRYACVFAWVHRSWIYLARIRVRSYNNIDSKTRGETVDMRAWRLTESCADNADPTKCANKRYLRSYVYPSDDGTRAF